MARLKVFKNRYKTATRDQHFKNYVTFLKNRKSRYKNEIRVKSKVLNRASTKLRRMTRDRKALNEKLIKLKVQAHLTRQQIANNRKLAAKLQAEERRSGLRSRKK